MQIKADVGNVFNDFYQFISNPNTNFIVTLCSGVAVLETLRLVVYKLGLYREFLLALIYRKVFSTLYLNKIQGTQVGLFSSSHAEI